MVEPVAGAGDYVQVGQGGLDHHNVRTLVNVRLDLPQGHPSVGGVRLVAASIAVLWGGICRHPEGAVEGGSMLGSIGHDG